MNLSDFCNVIRDWTNVQHSDALITSWVRMAEERMNEELRHKDMICQATAVMVDDSTELPRDWLELTSVRFPGKLPHHYVSEDKFWERKSSGYNTKPIYTIIGNTLMIDPIPPKMPCDLTISYYGKLVPIADGIPNYFLDSNTRLYTFATLALSAPYQIEDARVTLWEGEATRLIGMINASSKSAKYSGSPLTKSSRSFG
jgi:hypothetical protein